MGMNHIDVIGLPEGCQHGNGAHTARHGKSVGPVSAHRIVSNNPVIMKANAIALVPRTQVSHPLQGTRVSNPEAANWNTSSQITRSASG